MNTASAPRLAAPGLGPLDAWILSTYQRLDRLRVPAFAHLSAQHRLDRLSGAATDAGDAWPTVRAPASRLVEATLRMLPTDLPRDLPADFPANLPQNVPHAGAPDPARRLALLLRYLAAPMRYEPGTENAVHKAVPSSRGMFPLSFFLLLQGAGGTVAYEYLPCHHALREVVTVDAPALDAQVPAALVCIARIWRAAEIYGEFAHFPCILEAGHAHAQLNHLAAVLGLQSAGEVARATGRPLCRHAFELPLFAVALDLDPAALDLPCERLRLREQQGAADLGLRFPRLSGMHALFDAGAGSIQRQATAARCGDYACAPLQTMRARSAGNDRGGLAASLARLPDGLCAALARDWVGMRQARRALACETGLSLSLAWLGAGDTAPGLYPTEGEARPSALPATEFKRALAAMLPFPGLPLNLSTLVAIGVIEVDPAAALERDGPSALRDMHLAAGAAAQDLSLAAAAHGLFARPVRMMREARLEAALRLRGQVIYLVLLGVARRSRLSMELF